MRASVAKLLAASALCLATIVGRTAPPKDEEPPEVRYAAMLEAEYGPLGKTADAILSHEQTHEPGTLVGALVYRIRAKPLERLSLFEKRLLAVYGLKEDVDEGGFSAYFAAATGDSAAVALQGLREMGAVQLTRTMQKAMAVFPAGKPPVQQASRVKLIGSMQRRAQAAWSICDEEFYLREDGLAEVALKYAKKNRAQIVLP